MTTKKTREARTQAPPAAQSGGADVRWFTLASPGVLKVRRGAATTLAIRNGAPTPVPLDLVEEVVRAAAESVHPISADETLGDRAKRAGLRDVTRTQTAPKTRASAEPADTSEE